MKSEHEKLVVECLRLFDKEWPQRSVRAILAHVEKRLSEPTREMLAEADSAVPRFEPDDNGHRMMGTDGALVCWQTMLASSPLTPRDEKEQADG